MSEHVTVHELQRIVSSWHERTFPDATVNDIRNKVVEEAYELLHALDAYLHQSGDPDAVMDEAADVVIVLLVLSEVLDRSLAGDIVRKQTINLARAWGMDGHHLKGND